MLKPVPEGLVEIIVRDSEWCSRQLLRVESLDAMGLRFDPAIKAVAKQFAQKAGYFGDAYSKWQAEREDDGN
jgi:hypothetical protein